MAFFEGSISGEQEIPVSDTRDEIRVYTSADVTVAFWIGGTVNDWGPEIPVTSPVERVPVVSGKMRVTGTADLVIS